MERFDIAIIGTGPAGLSAALTAKARNKRFLLFGSRNLSEKIRKAHTISNYLGLPDISGTDMQKTFLNQIDRAGIAVTEKKVNLIYHMGDYFSLQAGNDMYEASAVILAAGMTASSSLPGEEEFLGRGVSCCATCDAMFYRGKKVVILGYSPEEESEASFMTEYASEVIYVPVYKKGQPAPSFSAPVKVLNVKPIAITGGMKATALQTDAGEIEADGFFILKESVPPSRLLPGLEMDGNHAAVKRDLSANIPGCFAAGDITGTPYQFIKAAGEGNLAALSAVRFLDRQLKK
ncbi:MAG: NAD(P)/FAD-dependent oxidoreductase [Eubacterium sp.]|nr:NAD(P)/FAD-dependent oxidoreductase [Eubacterium sp.]